MKKTRQVTELSDRQKLGRILFAFCSAQPLVKTLFLDYSLSKTVSKCNER
jgi:hypothetical protein